MMVLTAQTSNATAMVKFLFQVMIFGGAALAGVGALIFVFAKKNNNDDLSTNSIWIVLAGVTAAAVGTYMSTSVSLPSSITG